MARYETDGSGALAANDPYRGMERSDTRPNLKVIEGGKSSAEGARDDLASSERDAVANSLSVIEGGAGRAKEAEQNQPYSPRFVGAGLPINEKVKGKGSRKRGPLIAIIVLLMGGGGMIVGSQLLMPVATANRIIQEFNSMKTIMSRRSDRILRFQLDSERYKSPTRRTIFGNDKFKVSSKQAAKLKTEGIEYLQLDSGRRILVFDDGSGTKQPILTDSDAARLTNGDLDAGTVAEIRAKGGFADGVEINTKAMSVSSAFEVDGFKYGYLRSSKTWKGNIAGWFDSLVLKIFDRLNISRNRFKNWQNDARGTEVGNAAFREMASADLDTDDGTEVRGTDDDVADPDDPDVPDDPDAPPTDPDVESGADDDVIGPDDTPEEVETKLGNKARAVARAASGATSVTCAVTAAAGAINALAVAAEVSQILNFVTGYLESVQKVQAGDGDGSPMAEYTNMLTTKDAGGKTGMEAQGIGALFGSGHIDVNDESAKKYNLEEGIKSLGVHANYTIKDMGRCFYARFAAGATDAIIDVILLVGSFGIGNFLKGLATGVGSAVFVGMGVETLISAVIPGLAKLMTRDLINGAVGEDLGNAIASGGNMYMGKNHQGGGGSPGDAEAVLAYKRETGAILAEEAEYDRAMRSPFDASSQNTFLGSLLYSMMPLASSTSGLGIISSLGSLAQNSMTNLLPTASALADTSLITQRGDCPVLEQAGIMGDAYCNPYYTSDLSTVGADPGSEIFEMVARLDSKMVPRGAPVNPDGEGDECYNRDTKKYEYAASANFKYSVVNDDNPTGCVLDVDLNEEDNPVINLDSDLGKYIVYCGQRESQYGVADAAITAAVKYTTGNSTADTVLAGGLGAIPVGGGLADIVDAALEQVNAPWIGGTACVASSENKLWEENKYYQRYAEDQRLLEEAGILTKSGVTVALEEHYEENPLDKSYEGMLARYSGLSKDEVIATLDIIERANFVAEYDPRGLAPVAADEEPSLAEQAPDEVVEGYREAPVLQYIIYADVRNRYWVV